jgi:alginate O-acetyltransferase complex protein AlgI
MTFTSLAFVAFFILVSAAFYVLPRKARWPLLLISSSYFYMAFVPKYILILFALIAIDYCMARMIENSEGHLRRVYLAVSICATVGILFVFKYFNFFNANFTLLAHVLHWNYSISSLRLILPLGLSFHTFQSLSYVIEVFRGAYPSERNLGVYALYVLFFPQLIAGPIERPQHLLSQLQRLEEVVFDMSAIWSGLRIMAWGFFKKLVIADRLAASVDYIYAHSETATGLSILAAIVFFAFQLYADFSGYSDIARGAAKVLGIDLVRNFDRPYFSTSIAEFWRRWHMSLSNWFRDYFYYPLARTRAHATRLWLSICIITTFAVTGLWHGAGWTYISMGLLFGIYIALGAATKSWRERYTKMAGLTARPGIHRTLQQMQTFALVSCTWVFFRSPDMHTAFMLFRDLLTRWNISPVTVVHDYFLAPYSTLGFGRSELLLSGLGIFTLLLYEYWKGKAGHEIFIRLPLAVRSFTYSALIFSIVILGVFTTKQFIYFQF